MQFIKKLFRGLSSFAFKFLILITAVVAALVLTFNSPKKIEKSLNDSGVYSTFVSGALKEAQKSNSQNDKRGSSGSNDIPIDNPDVIAAANKAFTPQLLQSTTENVLNGTYDWLTGKTTNPSFTIDFAAAKQTFAQGVGQAAQKQLTSLPICTPKQAEQQGSDINAFTATCRPAGLNIAAQTKKVSSDLAKSKDFLGTPVLTPQNMPKNNQGQTIFDQLSKAPEAYKFINASPWLLIGLAVLAGLVTYLLYDSKRRGLRNLSITLTGTGIFLLLVGFGTSKAFHALNQPTGKLGEAVKGSFQQTIIKALNSISSSIEHVILWFGIIYVVIGVGTLLILYFTKPKKTEASTDKKEPTPPTDDSPRQEKTKPISKPASKPIHIQG